MNPTREALLFGLALTKPLAERAAWLDRECADDLSLRQRLEALLAGEAENREPAVLNAGVAGIRIEAGTTEATPTLLDKTPVSEGPGTVIGRYKLLEQIGEGGFGVVYLAEQREPVKRRVAMKIIKLGMDTRQVVARFEAERQSLALMEHPNIAKVFDAGATETGRPYFVMELVRGIRITDYCDQNSLSTKERLDLFLKVCQAIQHAHQKGIIHRDIKPSNILVTLQEGVPVPKVIDFGIAKATAGQTLTDKTLFTAFEQFIGTPAYMSPEQAELSGLDIDTRSDIYSLGVLLYELLAGSTPFDAKELMASGIDAMRKTIREKEPVRPSTRLAMLQGEELTTTAKCRSSDAPKLIHLLRGDLDWIVMKCLEKDRTRRYETANGLARDVQRHLNNEAVVARPSGKLYRFRKLARRNRVMFAATAMVVGALVVGLMVSTLMFSREQKARRLADTAQQAESKQKNEAILARERARASRYCSDMNLAWRARRENNLGEVTALLQAQVPGPGERDFRDWEWRYLWQACRGEELFSLGPMQGEVIGLGLLPGDRVITGEMGSGGVKVWDLERRQVVRRDEGTLGVVSDLAVSPDGRRIAVATWDVVVRFLDTRSLEVVGEFQDTSPVWKVAFSPDGQFLSFAGSAQVSVWELASHQQVWSKRISSGSQYHAPFSPDGQWLACPTTEGNVDLVKVKEGSLLQHIANIFGVSDLAVSRDGHRLAAATWAGEIHLIDLATQQTRVLTNHTATVRVAAFSPDGRQLASAGNDGLVKLWNVESGLETASFGGHRGLISSLVYSADGQRLFTGSKDGTVRVWPSQPKPLPPTSPVPPGFLTQAVSRDGRFLAAFDTNGLWCIANLVTLEENTCRGIPADFAAVAIGRDGREIAVGMPDGTVQVWNLADGTVSWSFRAHSNKVDALEFSPDWNRLASAARGDEVRVWDRNASQPRLDRRLGQASTTTRDLAFMPDGGTLLVARSAGNIHFLSLRQSGQDRKLDVADPYSLDVSTDGSLLSVGVSDAVRIYELSTLRPIAQMAGSLGSFVSVALSPNGRRVIGRDDQRVAWLWDVDSGREVGRFEGGVTLARFQPDSDTVVIVRRQSCELLRAPSLAEIAATEAEGKKQGKQ